MPSPVVTTFVDAALSQLRRLGLMWSPGVPDSMRDYSVLPSRDWIAWKPIPSTVADSDLDGLEREVGLTFPPLYRDLLQYVHYVELTYTGIRFERHLPQEWDGRLRRAYNQYCRDRILDVGLLPFGSESLMDAGPVCFANNCRTETGDCPVVFWDHEWIGTAKEVRPMFSSLAKMFECLTVVASNDLGFIISHFDDDDPKLIPQKQKLLAEFLRCDPAGAGGPARDYWTCWGVTPAQ